ncbi:alcohol dehydrogenase, iron-dependent [Cooperia oncophora]
MPRNVAIYSGFDVLCHALESYTALPYLKRVPRPLRPDLRPLYQGSNPISDVWSLEALRIMGKYFRRSVLDSSDEEAKERMLLASTFAGVGFGNAGVHLCHALSYPISSQGHSYFDSDYPSRKALIPHGLSVVTTAVADFEFLTPACPERHAEAARQLGATVSDTAGNSYIAMTLCDQIRGLMRDFQVPNGLEAMGFQFSDIEKLTAAALNAVENIAVTPRTADYETIAYIYEKSLRVY